VEQRLELSPPLNKLVIEELNQIFSKNGNSGKWNLNLFMEKRKDEDILELKQEKAKPQYVVKNLRSSPSYIGNFLKS